MKKQKKLLTEELNKIFEGQTISEETVVKASKIFESVLKEKEKQLKETYEAKGEAYGKYIAESILEQNESYSLYLTEAMSKKVDTMLDAVVEQWVKDNKLAINENIQEEIAMKSFNNVKAILESIEVDTQVEDVVKEYEEKIKKVKTNLEEQLAKNLQLEHKFSLVENKLNSYKKKDIIRESCSDLAESEKEKLSELMEDLSFDGEFANKVMNMKKQYFSRSNRFLEIYEDVIDKKEVLQESSDPYVKSTLNFLSRKS